MKLNKWLFTIPALTAAVPVAAIVSSCSCTQSNIILEGDCKKYLKVTNSSKYREGEEFNFQIQVKSEYVNEYFLPDDVRSIICGDELIYSFFEAEGPIWFTYSVDESHTWADIHINHVPGIPKLDFSLVTIKGVNVNYTDSFETKAFFEVGEKFNTNNIIVTIELTDGSEIEVDKSHYSYTSEYPLSPEVGKEYDFVIRYNGKNKTFVSKTQKAKCVAKNSFVRFNNERYTSIEKAVIAYNSVTEDRTYLMRIQEGTYSLNSSITINQRENKPLIITGDNTTVSLSNGTGNIFTLTNTDSVTKGSVSFYGLDFTVPTTTLTGEYNVVKATNVDGISFTGCSFSADATGVTVKPNFFNVLKTDGAKNISFYGCLSSYINTYITGSVANECDISIDSCLINNQISLMQISGSSINSLINEVDGSFFYVSSNAPTSAISLNGDGEIKVEYCNFEQLGSAEDTSAFIRLEGTPSGSVKNVAILDSTFEHQNPEQVGFYDIYNASTDTWTYQYNSTTPVNLDKDTGITFPNI